jgi:hypothetical protein
LNSHLNSKHNQLFLLACLAALLLAPLGALCAAEATYPVDATKSLDRLAGERTTISLNGTWQIDESVSATEVPKAFSHTLVVPGLVSLAKPEFPEVGTVSAKRNYFWYQKSFAAPARREAAILRF